MNPTVLITDYVWPSIDVEKRILKETFKVEDKYSDKESHSIEYYKTVDELNSESEEHGPQGVQCAQQ